MEFLQYITASDGKNTYNLCRAYGEDYNAVCDFLTNTRNGMQRKEFFYPYTDEELKNVLTNGYFMCIKDNDKIIATFAIDLDENYADLLANRVCECTDGKIAPVKAYESSGLMVDKNYRGAGLAKLLMSKAVEWAKDNKINLCGVVHCENVASLKTFFSNKFILSGCYEMDNIHKFVYLIKFYNLDYANAGFYDKINLADFEGHKKALKSGTVGIDLKDDTVLYDKISLMA